MSSIRVTPVASGFEVPIFEDAMKQGDYAKPTGAQDALDGSDYFGAAAAERIGYSLPRQTGSLPPEVQCLRTVEGLERALKNCRDAGEAERLRNDIQAKRAAFARLLEERARHGSGASSAAEIDERVI